MSFLAHQDPGNPWFSWQYVRDNSDTILAALREHVVLTGGYETWTGRWKPSTLPAGQALREPQPLFAKLDPDTVVAEELARMEAATPA